MPIPVTLDAQNAKLFLKYARLVSARGYVHNTLGNMAIRVPHPAYQNGVAYTKHAGLSLEEMELESLVITDIPTSEILCGTGMTSLGHNLNREILKLRPEINAVIHVHDDATIAFFGSGAFDKFRMISTEPPFVLGKPVHCLPAHVNVEADVSSVVDFIQETNAIILTGHGITTLGRSLSEAYHRLNTLTSEVRRAINVELIAALKGSEPHYRDSAEIEAGYRFADAVVYPGRAQRVLHD
jgi:ribulose-5-phosphate 4-epimerase/fuculose-1-phosphate aldolase